MDYYLIIYILLIFFASSFLKGITGLGFSTICLGILANIIDIKTAIPLVIIPSLCSNILVMVDAGRFQESLKRFRILFLSAIPGLMIGLSILTRFDNRISLITLGSVIVLYGLWAWRNFDFTISSKTERWLYGPVGFATGILTGMTGSHVIPALPFLLMLNLDKNMFVQSINLSFTVSGIFLLAGLGKLGLLTHHSLTISAAGIIPVALGIWLGGRIRQKIPDERFRKIVILLLIVIGFILILRS